MQHFNFLTIGIKLKWNDFVQLSVNTEGSRQVTDLARRLCEVNQH